MAFLYQMILVVDNESNFSSSLGVFNADRTNKSTSCLIFVTLLIY